MDIIFETYCIYLVLNDKYPGQHLRLNIIIFLLGLSVLKKFKSSKAGYENTQWVIIAQSKFAHYKENLYFCFEAIWANFVLFPKVE